MSGNIDRPARLEEIFPGDSEMARRMRVFDWAQTLAGSPARWPESLKTAVRIILHSRYPMFIWWGPGGLTKLYNDAYIPVLGKKHPWALGRPGAEVWAEIWDTLGPFRDAVFDEGRANWSEELPLIMERYGYREETFFTFSYSPILETDGSVGGLFCACTEDTRRVIAERRLKTQRALTTEVMTTLTIERACSQAALCLANHPQDVPFALIYLLDDDGRTARLIASAGTTADSLPAATEVGLSEPADVWDFGTVTRRAASLVVNALGAGFHGLIPRGLWDEPPRQALVVPLARPGYTSFAGFAVFGISPRRELDDDYRGFCELLAGHIATGIMNARAYEEERKRAEALAELDRAKTAFFSNVSHEFRTPLTLMLGPIEDALGAHDEPVGPRVRERLTVAHRNSLRLLRLVNTLLDFSRIEAGRVQASFEPTTIGCFTEELASNFRSAMERAGLEFRVSCPEPSEPVYIDREMWEKIVLNLVSNAFKFTLQGRVEVSLEERAREVELAVCDTGCGIPADQLPQVFQRFHRVDGTRGRTYEGTGIGLALVQELVKLHGGTVSVESEVGKGTIFRVIVRKGSAHLPADRIGVQRRLASTALDAVPFVEEALRWLPESAAEDAAAWPLTDTSGAQISTDTEPPPRIVVADDNADMRQYVARLLSEQFDVEAFTDGDAAVRAVKERVPDLVLTDVMMPGLGGFGVLKALRADPRTCDVPVIMLSARAGEESRVEGLQAGADDYLVKPFSARELVARVSSNIALARTRREAAQRVRAADARLRVALDVGRIGTWDADLQTREVTWSAGCFAVLGLDPATSIASVERWLQCIHPEDRARVQAAWESSLTGGRPYDAQYRVTWPTGEVRWLHARGHVLHDAHGSPVRDVGALVDITDMVRAAEAETRLALHAENSPLAIIEWDAGYRVIRWSLEAQRLFGWTAAEVLGKRIDEFPIVYEDDVAAVEEVMRGMGDGTALRNVSFNRNRRKDGSIIHCAWYNSALLNSAGQTISIYSQVLDRTKEVEALEALQAHQSALERQTAELRTMLDIIPVGVGISHDPRGDRITVNASLARLLRLEEEQNASVTGPGRERLGYRCVRNGIEIPGDELPMQAASQTGREVRGCEFDVVFADGRVMNLMVSAAPLLDEQGKVRGAIGAHVDITMLKQVQAEAQAAAERVRRLVDSNIIGIVFATDEGITEANDAFLNIVGYSRDEFERGGIDWRAMTPEEFAPLDGRALEELKTTGTCRPFEKAYVRKDGSRVPILIGAALLGGAPLEWVCFVIDLTERNRVLEELRAARAQEEASNRTKDEFLAMLAHELRNPLAPIRNAVQVLRTLGGEEPRVARTRELIDRQVTHMTRLVDDLLDVSRITSGKITLQRTRVSLPELIEEAVEAARPWIEQQEHTLSVTLGSDPLVVEADRARIVQVIVNLLTNAAKFTPRGGHITLSAGRTETGDAQVQVRDTGMGIPKEFHERVFELFWQEETSLARSPGGLGIGLMLVRRLVELHDGQIRVKSDGRGLGTEFTVILPALPTTTQSPAASGARDARGAGGAVRVLIVEDNADAAESFKMVLDLAGHEVRVASCGLDALRLLDEFEPTIAFVDLGLPDMSGFEVAARLRADPRTKGAVLVALTGYGREEDKQHAKKAGFNDHMTKPVNVDDVWGLLNALGSQPSSLASASRLLH